MNTDHIPIVNVRRPMLILKDSLKGMVTSHIELITWKLWVSVMRYSYYWSTWL